MNTAEVLDELKPQWIAPQVFAEKMERHWMEELGNVSSQPLREVWMQISDNFRANIVSHDDSTRRSLWRVLSPPTGSGKTESTMLYCSMLSELPEVEHPGVLIVVRLIQEADALAERINWYGLRPTAAAYHSKNEVKKEELRSFPVLIITHRAYELALDRLSKVGQEASIEATWPYFHDYNTSEGKRKLVVVDECLDIVEHSQAGLEELKELLGFCREELIAKHPQTVEMLYAVRDFLQGAHSSSELPANIVLPKTTAISPDFGEFISDYAAMPIKRGSEGQLQWARQQRNRHVKALKSLQAVFASWTYYSRIGGIDSTLNTSRLLLPEGLKGAVVMDATAATNKAYYNLFDDAKPIAPPNDVRCYSNFTLHVSKGHRVGKNYMEDEAKKVVPDFMAHIQPLIEDQDTFLVTHKDVEHRVAEYTDDRIKLGHWGGTVTGCNDYRDCDNVVIFGLPYLPDTWASNTFQAFRGVQTTEWFQNEEGRKARKALENAHLATSVIQALNRIRIRRTIDAKGNCELATGYLLLPSGDTAEYILEAIREAMPGINIVEWEYSCQKRKPKGSDKEKALLTFLRNMEKGTELSRAEIQRETKIGQTVLKGLISKIRALSTDLGKAVESLGVSYVVKREGKATRAYFQKC